MTISVSLSGPAYSFLLYENSKGGIKQEGFLLGEVVLEETRTITDNDQQQVHISKVIKVNSVLPCPQGGNYFSNGKINENKIQNFLGNEFSKVVAWYKFSLCSTSRFTLKDKLVHKQLREFFQSPHDLFSCCLLTTDATNNLATYTFTHSFFKYNNGLSERLTVHIPNLSENNNTYKTPETASETFNNIIKDLKLNVKSTQGVVAIARIQGALQKHINNVVDELSEAEKTLFELEGKVKRLNKNKGNVSVIEDSPKVPDISETANSSIESDHPSSSQASGDLAKKPKATKGRGRKKSTSNEDTRQCGRRASLGTSKN